MYRVCLETGHAGGDATARHRNPDLLGHVYVGPYLAGAPEHAFVVADDAGVAGYTLGAADTVAFAAWAEERWWPPLRAQYPLGDTASLDPASPDAELVHLLHTPGSAPDAVVAEYPAHLHIDLLPRIQGQGIGRALLERLFESLHRAGAEGVHLGVAEENERARRFYSHLGFEELDAVPGARFLGMRLA
jgi:ribosomal protein S18 acetylase RimI-like enzyme